jgi:hypothetical protein
MEGAKVKSVITPAMVPAVTFVDGYPTKAEPESIGSFGRESPSDGMAIRLAAATYPENCLSDSQMQCIESGFVLGGEENDDGAPEGIEGITATDFAEADEPQPGDAGAASAALQAGKPTRKKINIDARHLAIFDIISALLGLASGADVHKTFLADMRLLAELTAFLDRPAASKIIFTWGHLSEASASDRGFRGSPGRIKKKGANPVKETATAAHSDLLIADSWMIYKEEVPAFLNSFLFFLRVFCIFGIKEPVDALQFISVSAFEKGLKILQGATAHPLDVSQILNSQSRSAGFGSPHKEQYVTMEAFCRWLTSLGVETDLSNIWDQQLRPESPSAMQSRRLAQDVNGTEAVKSIASLKQPGGLSEEGSSSALYQPISNISFHDAEEKLLHLASSTVQLHAALRDVERFSAVCGGSVEAAHVDRWLVQLFPMLDFAPAFRSALRHLSQTRQQDSEHKIRDPPNSKPPNVSSDKNKILTIKEFGALLVSVVYYRRM